MSVWQRNTRENEQEELCGYGSGDRVKSASRMKKQSCLDLWGVYYATGKSEMRFSLLKAALGGASWLVVVTGELGTRKLYKYWEERQVGVKSAFPHEIKWRSFKRCGWWHLFLQTDSGDPNYSVTFTIGLAFDCSSPCSSMTPTKSVFWLARTSTDYGLCWMSYSVFVQNV